MSTLSLGKAIYRSISFYSLICTATVCSAISLHTDTLQSQQLSEVVIEAENQRTSAAVSTYIPATRQKNAAQNAVSLLGLMAIPQLDVDLASLTVKTIAGQQVAIFIDYNEATPQDLEGLRTQDVKRVELYNHPADARFKGARHVVNFIMQKYEYGGYTKVKAAKQFCVNSTDASLYSKMAYKSMTYDIYADESYLTDRHKGSDNIETFRFPDLFNEGQKTMTRHTATDGSRLRNNANNVAFRALYSSSKIQASNRVNFNYATTPVDESANSIAYSPDIIPAEVSHQKSSAKNLTAGYNGDFFFSLTKQFSLQTEIIYTYGHNTTEYSYISAPDFSITNNAAENSHDLHINPRLSFQIDGHNKVMLFGSGVWRRNDISYTGNTPSTQRYGVQAYFAGAHYDLTLDKIQAGGEIGWAWEKNSISGISSADNFPQINAYANYMPAQKHLLTLSWNYGKDVPDASQKSPNMLRQDELMWVTGTPGLKDYRYMNCTLTYTWLPNYRWQLAANGGLFNFDDRCVTVYTPTAPDGTMLKKYTNGGNYRAWMFNLNATAKFFNGSLVVSLIPQYWIYRTNGAYRYSIDDFNGRIQASYYIKNFFFVGSYSLKRHYPATQAEYEEWMPEQYELQAGWGNGTWNVSATAYNFFRKSWHGSRQKLKSEYYDYSRSINSTQSHMRFSLSTTYTFGYGKKVDPYNEVSKGESSKSAILQ